MATGKLKFVKRGGAVAATLSADDLAAHEYGQEPGDPLTVIRAEELDLPLKLGVAYINIGQDYGKGFQQSPRVPIGSGSGKATLTLPIVMDDTKAQQVADVNYFNMRTARTTYALMVSRAWSKLEPTDPIDVLGHRMMITKKDDGRPGILDLKAVMDDADIYTQTGAAASSVALPAQTIKVPVQTRIEFLDIPLLRDQDEDAGFYVAACGYTSGWSGCILFKSTDSGSTYSEIATITQAATIGYALSALGDFAGGNVFDEANFVDVFLFNGTLSSVTETQALNGANPIVLGNEELNFKNAVLIATNTYRVSGFLRGRKGTESAMASHLAGDRFVFADISTWRRISASSAEIGVTRYYKAVSFGMTLQQTSARAFANSADGLECLSVVNPGVGVDAAGNATINFSRRGRLYAEWRDYVDVPLSEATESYEIEVWSYGFAALKRTIAVSAQTASYTAAQQVTDFGSVQRIFNLKIYQLSATVGRGHPAIATLSIPVFSTQWRIYCTASEGGASSLILAEIEMRATVGGADQCVGGTASADSEFSGSLTAANAFDNSLTTNWRSGTAGFPHWNQYTFAAPVTVGELMVHIDTFSSNALIDWNFEYYNGTSWVPAFAIVGEPGWTAGETRLYTVF